MIKQISKDEFAGAFIRASGARSMARQSVRAWRYSAAWRNIYAQVIDDRKGAHAGGGFLDRKGRPACRTAAMSPAPRRSAS